MPSEKWKEFDKKFFFLFVVVVDVVVVVVDVVVVVVDVVVVVVDVDIVVVVVDVVVDVIFCRRSSLAVFLASNKFPTFIFNREELNGGGF